MRKFVVLSLVALLSALLSGCAGKASISARKGYVRNPAKHYASGE